MARPVTGKIMEDRLWVKQKNGTWYCYERKRVWEDGKAKNISKTLLGKADERGGELKPTRAKRKPGTKAATTSAQSQSKPTALSDILNFIGTDSGIDADLRLSCGYECSEEVVALARYAAATDRAAWPGIEAWMLTHPVPCYHPITREVRLNLFEEIGDGDTGQWCFSYERCKHVDDDTSLIAFDVTTLASRSDHIDARVGLSGDRRGISTLKNLVLYSLDHKRPLAYCERETNVSDALSIGKGLGHLKMYADAEVPVVTDASHASEAELDALIASDTHLLARVDADLTWVREAIEPQLNKLENPFYLMESDMSFHGFPVKVDRNVGTAEGSQNKEFHLLVYRDFEVKLEQDKRYIEEIWRVKRLVEEGAVLDEHSERIRKRYLRVRRLKQKLSVTMNNNTVNGDARLNGVFVLVSDHLEDANEAFGIWQTHERIQDGLGCLAQESGRLSSSGKQGFVLAGRMFVQFVALCYTEEIVKRIESIKRRLDKAHTSAKYGGPAMGETEEDLWQWLEGRSVHDILLWFDAYETQAVSHYVTDDKWDAEGVARDRLFLELFGMKVTTN